MRVLERGIQLAFSGKCSVQVNQVSITETFNVKNMERRNDQETRQKAEGVFQTQEGECDVEQGILTQQTDPLALCHADLRQDVDR